MRYFVDYIINNVRDKIFVAYNGGKFDFIILLKELINNPNVEVKQYLKNGSRVLQYEFNGNKIFDLINFTLCGLAAACEAYKISDDKKKSEFDHSLINNWVDVAEFEDNVRPYLQLDLISMKELFIKIQ